MLTVAVNMENIFSNIELLKRKTNAAFCAVVKADAYGHGDRIAAFIEDKVDYFAVSTLIEANKLAEYGISKPIYILTPAYPKIIMPNFIYTITSFSQLIYLNSVKSPYIKYISIKINTGMNRLGVDDDELKTILDFVYACNNMEIFSVFTHFYDGGSWADTERQFTQFNLLTKNIFTLRHCCASSAMLLDKRFHLDAVRIGLSMYGYGHKGLLPAMSVYTQILQVIRIKKGDHIGYGSLKADRDMTVATIAAGYADGYRRLTDKKRFVSLRGKLLRVLSVCMDMSIIDAGQCEVREGEDVYLLGNGVDVEALAESYNSIPYEVLTSFKGDRVKHIYL